jgi:hypothetical protein
VRGLYITRACVADMVPFCSVEHYYTTGGDLQDCKVQFGESTWEVLPTLHNVVDGLKTLKLGKVREAAVQKLKGASDCSPNKRVEW